FTPASAPASTAVIKLAGILVVQPVGIVNASPSIFISSSDSGVEVSYIERIRGTHESSPLAKLSSA
ncbi:MAG: hypothetical protein WBF30_16410, partial [Candidatus Acidiferrales bacterium]